MSPGIVMVAATIMQDSSIKDEPNLVSRREPESGVKRASGIAIASWGSKGLSDFFAVQLHNNSTFTALVVLVVRQREGVDALPGDREDSRG